MPASQAGRRRFDPGRPLHFFPHGEKGFNDLRWRAALDGRLLVTVLVTVPNRIFRRSEDAGRRAAVIDYLHQQLTVEAAAVFLGTTKGQLYNLLNRRGIPYVRWGKRGKRFRRIDLIAWEEDGRRPTVQ